MRRRLVITEEFGAYRVRTENYDVASTTLEGALRKASDRCGVPRGVEVRSMFDASEILDSLLGRKEGS